ncbi:MAG: preprotein translocase subunit SecD [Parcubacteria group bacterium Gr01-1014_17]|nr:MAG: preprotein translocase subunit SecD [Parcubacteria group bacterium Gr01-1014_17]
MWKYRVTALIIFVTAALVGFFVYKSEMSDGRFAFRLGLDLKSGAHLVYRADTKSIPSGEVTNAMKALRDVVERRVNLFGVSEPLVQVERGGAFGGGDNRLIVELPGITDVKEAAAQIGKTPLLEFKLMKDTTGIPQEELEKKTAEELFVDTGLTGRLVSRATISFNQTTGEPVVVLAWMSEGEKLFAKLTKENVGKTLGIFLDGTPISLPVIREEIASGSTEISGNFNIEEARTLVRDLNYGALPVPVSLASVQTIGASLGTEAVTAGMRAGLWAFLVIAVFLVFWYRLPGLLATFALGAYVALNLAIFKLIPVTLTAAGIAGFVLSMGMAVDANILIFARLKEELRKGKHIADALKEGFARAWPSIRDSNTSSIITAVILYYFAATPVVRGFALVFGLGVIVSMFTAITASRMFLYALGTQNNGSVARFLFGSGIK